MIGSGVGSLVGGEISEELGGSYELGAFVGNLVGGVAGSMVFKCGSCIPKKLKGSLDLDASFVRKTSKPSSFADLMSEEEALRYNQYWAKNAPKQVAPGAQILEGQNINGLGRVEPWTAYLTSTVEMLLEQITMQGI